MVWPGDGAMQEPSSYSPAPTSNTSKPQQQFQGQKGFSTQGTQTSPTMASQSNQNGTQPPVAGQQLPAQPKKPRRPPGKRYAMAARERRLQQDYNNYHHPPKEEDIWICEFCEYESIFGAPPEALVRQYEIKDRRERKRLAEKRRLLEKAKLKGRKGKKGNKNATKNNSANQPQQSVAQANYQQSGDQVQQQTHGTQSDDYLADDYDDPNPSLAPPLQPQPASKAQQSAPQPAANPRSAGTNGLQNSKDGMK